MKRFNTEGACNPSENYMVDLTERLRQIKGLIDQGKYFSINRARQYGKTTTLSALEQFLQPEYLVISLDFQFLTHENFKNEHAFVSAFVDNLIYALSSDHSLDENVLDDLQKCADLETCGLSKLFQCLSALCKASDKPIVLIIDEVDSATNNQVFLDFLALLRGYYLHRAKRPCFRSVILAGVYDIKQLQYKIRPEEEHKTNSPWNIAADFDIDMELDQKGIQKMLSEYENDHHTGMQTDKMAGLLYAYTSGYPYLVSRLCKLMDEKIAGTRGFSDKTAVWTREGFLEAVKMLLLEKNSLFESLINKLVDFPQLREILYSILFLGNKVAYNPDQETIDFTSMLGFVKNDNGSLVISNRIFETRLYNYFLSNEEISSL